MMITKYFKINKPIVKFSNKSGILKKINQNKKFRVKDSTKKLYKEYKLYDEFPVFEKINLKKNFITDNDLQSDNELIENDISVFVNNLKESILKFNK